MKRATGKTKSIIAKVAAEPPLPPLPAKAAETPPPPATPSTSAKPLPILLHDIRSEALRDRTNTSKVIAQLHAQREQLEEMRNEIDATIAFLRAQRNK